MKIDVNVKPGSKTDSIEKVGDELVVRVKARAVDGKANEAVVKLLAKHFGVRQSQVTVLRGQKSRQKVVEIEGVVS